MKKTIAAFAFALFATSAMAADVVEEAPVEPIVQGFTWTGGYAGVFAGYGWGDASFTDSDVYNTDEEFSFDANGFLGGVQAGYNWQSGNFVYGVEAELGYLDLDDSASQPSSPDGDTIASVDGGVYAGFTARLGYAFDRTLIYAKGGAVYSGGDFSISDTCDVGACGGGLLTGDETIGFGYQIGAGVEHALTDKWTIKLEYAYFDFGNETVSGVTPADVEFDYDADFSAHTVKIGLNYKF